MRLIKKDSERNEGIAKRLAYVKWLFNGELWKIQDDLVRDPQAGTRDKRWLNYREGRHFLGTNHLMGIDHGTAQYLGDGIDGGQPLWWERRLIKPLEDVRGPVECDPLMREKLIEAEDEKYRLAEEFIMASGSTIVARHVHYQNGSANIRVKGDSLAEKHYKTVKRKDINGHEKEELRIRALYKDAGNDLYVWVADDDVMPKVWSNLCSKKRRVNEQRIIQETLERNERFARG